MAYKINLPGHSDPRGKLTVIDKLLPFPIKRVFYVYDATETRGGHRHHRCTQALIAIKGTVSVYCNNGKNEETIVINKPSEALIVPPEDWHTMDFSKDAILLVLASHEYDKTDYIDEKYP